VPRILIVDDKPSNRELLQIVLEQQGHLIAEAADGNEVLRKIQEQATGLLLLNLTIPIDGYEVSKQIRSNRRPAELLVVAVIVNAMQKDHENILAAGSMAMLPHQCP
jgi:CheY-like chemotaxis protein